MSVRSMVPKEAAQRDRAVVVMKTVRYWDQTPDPAMDVTMVAVNHVMYRVQQEFNVVENSSRTEIPVLVLQEVGSNEQRIVQIH